MVTYDHSEVEWLYGDGDGSYSNARAGCFEISEDLYSKYTSKDRRLSFWFSDSRVFLQSWQTVKKETNTDS